MVLMGIFMLDKFISEGLNILRVYSVVGGQCTCKTVRCSAPGKHPAPWQRGQNKGVYNARPAKDCSESDFSQYNLGVACGNGLLVVDIDPRNGGHIAWHELSKGQYLPDTWEVSTGSGGTHIYYRVPHGVTVKSQSFRGIDIQSAGKYVVAPPSMHRDGGQYEWSDDSADTLAEIPPWLLSLLKAHDSAVDAAIVDDDTGGLVVPAAYEWPLLESILSQLTPRIGYDAWVSVGMGLHATGNERAFDMWDSWSAKDPEQYSSQDCRKKWNSFKILPGQRYTYRYLYSLAEMYGIKYSDDKFLRNWKSTPVTLQAKSDDNEGTSCLSDLDHGPIINALYYGALDSARIPINSLALASALQIMSAAVQGTFKTWTGAPLSLYQWIAAGASAGKDGYVQYAKEQIKAIHPNLLSQDLGSSSGLRVALQAFNSLVMVCDEWHDVYLKLATSNNEYSRQLLSDYKIIFNGPPELSAVITKIGVQPPVLSPILGILGVGTVAGLSECGQIKDFLSSGAASRFLFWIHATYEHSPAPACRYPIHSEPVGELRRLFLAGRSIKIGELPKSLDRVRSIQSSMQPSRSRKGSAPVVTPSDPGPIMIPKRCVTATSEAMAMVEDFETGIYQTIVSMDLTQEDDLISLLNRQALSIIKLACLRAISDSRCEVKESDVLWARAVVQSNVATVKSFFELSSGTGGLRHDGEKYRLAGRMLKTLARESKPVTIGRITERLRSMRGTVQECLETLIAQNRVIAVDSNGNRCYSVKITDKTLFISNGLV
jgi:hypothetical protein